MKLIIDVEKDYYEMIKYNVEHGQEYKPFEIISNGIPYEPKGDLISRSEAEKLGATCLAKRDENGQLEAIISLDYAPTVEPFEPDYVGAERVKARQRGYEQGYHNGMEIGKTLNPKIKQGEWITVHFTPDELNCPEKSRFDFVKCPFCEVIHQGRHNFCSYCGAKLTGSEKMKGGAV